MGLDTNSSEGRIFWGAIGLGLIAGVTVGAWRGPAAGVGVALGAGFSVVNYAWLRSGANALVAAAAGNAVTQPMRWGLVRFLMRFGLLAGCVYAILISRLVPLPPVLGGLFVVPAAAVAEGLRLILVPHLES
ncbi:MAG: ATP synthase subunit I [Terriglobales bacterium]